MYHYFCLLVLCLLQATLAQHAPTWDTCQCEWVTWKEWSDCTTTCFGTQLRTRDVKSIDIDGCEEFEDCDYGDGGIERRGCNEVCHNGGTPTGGLWQYCDCREGNTGSCCEQSVDCGHPGNIENGNVDLTDTTYGNTVTYSCNQFYNLTGGDHNQTCQGTGIWSGTKPSCVFVNTCASNPCQNLGTCIDGLNMYTCLCEPGWSGQNCEYDIQPPVIRQCSDNYLVYATERTVYANWTAPEIFDPLNNILDIKTNYPSPEFTFPWGDFIVQYVATKTNNGMSAECIFQIKVRPTPCEDLNIPENGARVCNGWQNDYVRVCIMACQEGYTMTPPHSFEQLYVCGASGNWMYPAPMPNCSVPVDSKEDALIYQPAQASYSFASCADAVTVSKLKQQYIDVLMQAGELSTFCTKYPDECHPGNVDFACT